jgi:hypothetical protein
MAWLSQLIPSPYIFVAVKLPFPLQPDTPVRVQVPEIVLLFTVPCRVSTLLVWGAGSIVEIVVPNVPVIFPLKFPVKVNVPVSLVCEAKQDEVVEKVRFVTLTEVPLLWVKDVVKAKAGDPSGFVKVAVQLPLMLAELLDPPPHPPSISPSATSIANTTLLMGVLLLCFNEPLAPPKVAPYERGCQSWSRKISNMRT